MPPVRTTTTKKYLPSIINPYNKEHNKLNISGFKLNNPRNITSQLPKHTSLITDSNDSGYNVWRSTKDSETLTKEKCEQIQFNDQTLAIQKQSDLRTTLGEGYVNEPHPAIERFINENEGRFTKYTILGRLDNLGYYSYQDNGPYNVLVVPDDNYTTVLNKEFILCSFLTNTPIFILIPNKENSLMSIQGPSVTANEVDTIILRLLNMPREKRSEYKIYKSTDINEDRRVGYSVFLIIPPPPTITRTEGGSRKFKNKRTRTSKKTQSKYNKTQGKYNKNKRITKHKRKHKTRKHYK
jgi:hypothetical protein